jgi:predicted amidohydrolase
MICHYRKIHLFGPAGERKYFKEGKELAPLFEINGIKIGLLICWDIEFPEPIRVLSLQGMEFCIAIAANSATFTNKITVPSRAFENQVFVLYANCCGKDSMFDYCGLSNLCDPRGNVLAICENKEQSFQVDIEPDQEQYKANRERNPFWEDRRPHLYKTIADPK